MLHHFSHRERVFLIAGASAFAIIVLASTTLLSVESLRALLLDALPADVLAVFQ